MASLAGYALLLVRNVAEGRILGQGGRRVRIVRLEYHAVMLAHVAPEFVEAYRIHRSERLASDQ
jgi:hypothetical protein